MISCNFFSLFDLTHHNLSPRTLGKWTCVPRITVVVLKATQSSISFVALCRQCIINCLPTYVCVCVGVQYAHVLLITIICECGCVCVYMSWGGRLGDLASNHMLVECGVARAIICNRVQVALRAIYICGTKTERITHNTLITICAVCRLCVGYLSDIIRPCVCVSE